MCTLKITGIILSSNYFSCVYYRFLKKGTASFLFCGQQEQLLLEKEAQRDLEFQTFQIYLNNSQIFTAIFRVLVLVSQCSDIYIRDM